MEKQILKEKLYLVTNSLSLSELDNIVNEIKYLVNKEQLKTLKHNINTNE